MARVESTGALRNGAARPPPAAVDLDAFYDGLALVAERAPGDVELFARYHYDAGGLHAVTAEFAPGAASTHVAHRGALGSTLLMTDGFGDAASSYRTDPWGRLEPAPSLDDPNALVFTGHQHDALTGLIYMKSRMYDPALGAFLTQDSYLGRIDLPASLHRYLYAYGNPARYTDPDGRCIRDTGITCEEYFSLRRAREADDRLYSTRVDASGELTPQGDRLVSSADANGRPVRWDGVNDDLERQIVRSQGAAQVLGGAAEAGAGIALCLAPEPTGATKVACAAAVAHGTDHVVAGARSVWTGARTRTATETALSWIAEAVGASEETAQMIGASVDVGLSVLVPLGTGLAARSTGVGWFDDVLDEVRFRELGGSGVAPSGVATRPPQLFGLLDDVEVRLDADDMPGIGSFGDEVGGVAAREVATPRAGQKVYRVYGGDARPDGASWTPNRPSGNYRDAAGLPSGGPSGANNSGRFVIEGTLQDPSAVVRTRRALPLDGSRGGAAEYIIPNPIENGAVRVDRVSGVNPEF